MKQLTYILNLVAAVCALAVAPEAYGAATIYGTMVSNSKWGTWDTHEGIYSFQAEDGTTITEVHVDPYDYLAATAGGVLVDKTYHLFYDRGGSSQFSVSYTALNITDWSTSYAAYFDSTIASNDMAYDSEADRVYCAQKSGTAGKLAMWNPSNIDEVTNIGTTSVELVALATDANNNLYGVGSDGILYSVSKSDATLTAIGDTGLKPNGAQSAVFDFSDGTLYLAAYTKDKKSALYSIDTTTGAATKITDFADNARFRGLYMLTSATPTGVPAVVEDLAASFPNGSNDGTVTFTMPSQTFGGSALNGDLQYRLESDSDEIATGSATAGSAVSLPITLPAGNHTLNLYVSNEVGTSPRAKLTIYVGKGAPGYVAEPTVARTETLNQVEISWKAPDYCIPLDAYFDIDNLKYDVVRLPDNVKVADHISDCRCTDNIPYTGPLTIFKYEITPYIDDIKGNSLTTNGVAIGDPLNPPYEAAMVSADLDYFTIIDGNKDGNTWCKDFYDYGVCCGGRWDGECDDWLILPPLRLEGNGVYRTIINVANDYDGPSKWELKIGKAPTAAAMTTTLMPATSTVNSFDGDIKIDEDGTYYIGIHCIGAAGTTMFVKDIIVRGQTNHDAPDMPVNLTGEGAPKGELAAILTFTTPSMTIGGDRLDELTAINIYHGEKLVKTLENVEPDTEYTCKVEADQEFNTYFVAAVNENGEGRRAKIEYVFAGYDYPGNVTNITLTEDSNGHPHLSWIGPGEVGIYGYYVNPEEVTYEIYRSTDNQYDYELVAEGLKAAEFTDTDLSPDCDQYLLQYYIYPVNSIGRGYGYTCAPLCFGRPFAAPFIETFPDGTASMLPWYYETSNAQNTGWLITKLSDTNLSDYDGSNGMMSFHSTETGDNATLHAPYISIKGIKNPVLEFYYYAGQSIAPIQVMVNGTVVENSLSNDNSQGWHCFKASLAGFKDAKRIELTFRAESTQGDMYAFIDNVRVREQYDSDLAVSYFSVPEQMTLGVESTQRIGIRNDGTKASSAKTAILECNGYALDEIEVKALEPTEQVYIDYACIPNVTFGEEPSFKVRLMNAGDDNPENDESETLSSSLTVPRFPAPENLNADSDGNNVVLTWDVPTAKEITPDPIVEDFEGYPAFAIEMSPWTLIDGDKLTTNRLPDPDSWYEYLQYDHAGEPTAYQIFDPQAAGIDLETYYYFAPHSGSKAAVCWSVEDWSAANDDWLISPELYPGAQTISFWAYSRTGWWDTEKYEVLYSSTDTNPDNFTLLMSDFAPADWTEISVDLPEDAKYFAIHTVSAGSTSETWYDDIRFIPATSTAIPLDLLGYNVYRNNKRLNSELLTQPTYTDTPMQLADYKYNVTAVYGVGESIPSNDVSIFAGSVESLGSDVAKAVGGEGNILILNAPGEQVRVHTVSGILKTATVATDSRHSIPAHPGIYIVTIGSKAYKVMVK